MKILMVTPSWPSELHRIRSLNLIKAFNELGIEVYLFSLLVHPEEGHYVEKVGRLVKDYQLIRYSFRHGIKEVVKHFWQWGGYPWEYLFLKDNEVREKLNNWAKEVNPDLLYIKRLRTLAISDDLLSHYPTLLDTTDAMSLFYKGYQKLTSGREKLIGWHEYKNYLKLERRIVKDYPSLRWIVSSPVDKSYLEERVGVRKIWLWPNVVDTRVWKGENRRKDSSQPKIIFSGLMNKVINYRPALELINEIWPIIHPIFPGSQLLIVGPRPISSLRTKSGQKGVVVTGLVPDLKMILSQGYLYLAWGQTLAGSRNKILQAAAMGLPVVASREMIQGLDNVEEGITVVKTRGELIQSIKKILADDKLRNIMSWKARKWVSSNYSLDVLKKRVKKDLKIK